MHIALWWENTYCKYLLKTGTLQECEKAIDEHVKEFREWKKCYKNKFPNAYHKYMVCGPTVLEVEVK